MALGLRAPARNHLRHSAYPHLPHTTSECSPQANQPTSTTPKPKSPPITIDGDQHRFGREKDKRTGTTLPLLPWKLVELSAIQKWQQQQQQPHLLARVLGGVSPSPDSNIPPGERQQQIKMEVVLFSRYPYPSCLPPSSLPLPASPLGPIALPSRLGFAACSAHSSARILKPNRRSPYGRPVSAYHDDEEDDDEEEGWREEEEDEDEDEDSSDDEDLELFDNDLKSLSHYTSFDGLDFRRKSLSHYTRGSKRLQRKDIGERSSKITGSLKHPHSSHTKHDKSVQKRNSAETYFTRNKLNEMSPVDEDERGKVKMGKITENRLQKLREEIGLDEKWIPLIEYLSTFGLKESDFVSIYERHMPCLQINVASAQERLEFLLRIGVKTRDIRKILIRQPQILEYTVENNLKPHVVFLTSLGIPDSRIGQVITATPSLFSYSIELSLKPTVRYLVEKVGIKASCVSKVVQLSPQILVQRIDNSWNSRLYFLSKELGAPRNSIVKMVTKHPQLLHYSIEDGIQPRINFLRSIGMRNSDILKVLTSLTQVLSLSLEGNLKPKYLYLVNELHNEVQSLTKYPMYLSLSLEQRIRPRHQFLVSLKKAPRGPFPLSSLIPTDENFCQQWAGTSLENYLAFRQSLLLTNFAKKYEKR